MSPDREPKAAPRWQAHPASTQAWRLGEGPYWEPWTSTLRWVDVPGGLLVRGHITEVSGSLRVDPVDDQQVGPTASCVVSSLDGQLLVAAGSELLVLEGGRILNTACPLPYNPGHRFNDGACDPSGTFVVGTLTEGGFPAPDAVGTEILAMVGSDAELEPIQCDLHLSNGIGWSPGGSTMYNVDSLARVLWARPWTNAGPAGPPRLVRSFPGEVPDGIAVDVEGHIWVAMWGSGQVRRHAPDGQLTGVIDVGPPLVTSVAFVGAGLDHLVVTTAGGHLTADGHHHLTSGPSAQDHPHAGRLFAVRLPVRGLPVTPWTGFTPKQPPTNTPLLEDVHVG